MGGAEDLTFLEEALSAALDDPALRLGAIVKDECGRKGNSKREREGDCCLFQRHLILPFQKSYSLNWFR